MKSLWQTLINQQSLDAIERVDACVWSDTHHDVRKRLSGVIWQRVWNPVWSPVHAAVKQERSNAAQSG